MSDLPEGQEWSCPRCGGRYFGVEADTGHVRCNCDHEGRSLSERVHGKPCGWYSGAVIGLPKSVRIGADNDQDLAELSDWWDEVDPALKADVLTAILRDYDDPVMDIMSRFAQLAFGEIAERKSK